MATAGPKRKQASRQPALDREMIAVGDKHDSGRVPEGRVVRSLMDGAPAGGETAGGLRCESSKHRCAWCCILVHTPVIQWDRVGGDIPMILKSKSVHLLVRNGTWTTTPSLREYVEDRNSEGLPFDE